MIGPITFPEDDDFSPLPKGVYEAVPILWEHRYAASGESDYILGKFAIEREGYGVRHLSIRWSLKPSALWRLRRDLISLGVPPEEVSGRVEDLDTILDVVFDGRRTVKAFVGQEYYTPGTAEDGRTYNVITRLSAA